MQKKNTKKRPFFLYSLNYALSLCRQKKAILFNGVMAAQQILVLFVLVRIQVEQQHVGSVAQLDRATAF